MLKKKVPHPKNCNIPVDVAQATYEVAEYVLSELMENIYLQKPLISDVIRSQMTICKLLKTIIDNGKRD